MSDFIKNAILKHATINAWTNPIADRRLTFKPALFTTRAGALGKVSLPWADFTLPDETNRYVLMQFGQLTPEAFGIDSDISDWQPIDTIIARDDLFLQLHTASKMLFLGNSFVRKMPDRSVGFAINLKDNKSLIDLKEEFFIRFYSNAWLLTSEGNVNSGVKSSTLDVVNFNDVLAFVNSYQSAKSGDGNIFLYKNGIYLSDINVADIQLGDKLEFIVDSTGNDFFDVQLSDLPSFDSSIDKKKKYIVIQPGDDDGLLAAGDIEIYICSDTVDAAGNTITKGIYYSQLYKANLRSLTHRDWAIETLRVQNIISNQDEKYPNPYLRVFKRHSSWSVKNIIDGSFIRDLYLLNDVDRKIVMSTGASEISEWKAENLEQSGFVKWLDYEEFNINFNNLKNVFCYNGLNSFITKVVIDNNTVILPPAMNERGGLVLFYDGQGLLRSDLIVNDGSPIALPVGVKYVDVVPGDRAISGFNLEATSLQVNDPIDTLAQELYYRDSTLAWKLAVKGVDYHVDLDKNVVNWGDLHTSHTKAKRLASRFYKRSFTIRAEEVATRLEIFENNDYPVSGLELGRLRLWANGQPCIRGLDYVVEYPYFRFLGRQYYDTSELSLKLVYSGLSSDKAEPKFGFIKYRTMNHNSEFDLTLNREVEITIAGHRAVASEISFNEDKNRNVMDGRYLDGMPYSIEYPLEYLGMDITESIVSNKVEAMAQDSKIEKYLSLLTPEKKEVGNITIQRKHGIVSPFMHTIIEDIIAGKLILDYTVPSEEYVATKVAGYLAILDLDPINNPHIDWTFIDLHPSGRNTPSVVTQKAYNFLSKVNQIYLQGKCVLTSYLNVLN